MRILSAGFNFYTGSLGNQRFSFGQKDASQAFSSATLATSYTRYLLKKRCHARRYMPNDYVVVTERIVAHDRSWKFNRHVRHTVSLILRQRYRHCARGLRAILDKGATPFQLMTTPATYILKVIRSIL